MNNVTRRTYKEQIQRLSEFENWLNGHGVITKGTVFQEIFNNMRLLDEYYQKGNINGLLKVKKWDDLYYSLLGCDAFIDTYNAFYDAKLPVDFKKKIKESLNLPLVPLDEDPQIGSNNPRNYLLEFQMIARLRKTSATILGYDDVDFRFNNIIYNLQCKRIFSRRKVKANIKKAKKQIQERIDSRDTKGIICLGIEKITGTEGKILEVNHEKEICSGIGEVIDTFVKENEKYWIAMADTRIHAVFIFFQGVAYIKSMNLLTNCFLLSVCPLVSPECYQRSEYENIRNLAMRLKNRNVWMPDQVR